MVEGSTVQLDRIGIAKVETRSGRRRRTSALHAITISEEGRTTRIVPSIGVIKVSGGGGDLTLNKLNGIIHRGTCNLRVNKLCGRINSVNQKITVTKLTGAALNSCCKTRVNNL